MSSPAKTPYITPQEYLERERKAEFRSEYHDGQIVERAVSSWWHNRIMSNLIFLVGTQLKHTSYEPFAIDMRVRVPQCNCYYYPDMAVVCSSLQLEDAEQDVLLNPTLILEVFSKSTERYDREGKFDCYRTLESLSTYVLVAQDRPRIESFTRQADGSWHYEMVQGLDAVVKLEAIGCTLSLADVYARVEFPSAPSPTC